VPALESTDSEMEPIAMVYRNTCCILLVVMINMSVIVLCFQFPVYIHSHV